MDRINSTNAVDYDLIQICSNKKLKAEYHNKEADIYGCIILQSAQDTCCQIVEWIHPA